MSIISLHAASLHFADNQLLDNVTWQVQPHDRIALVGRNGAGKSTLLKLLQGDLVLDGGQINRLSGLRIAGLTQEVPISEEDTVSQILVKSLGMTHTDDGHDWDKLVQIETMASRLGITSINERMNQLSGGMKRRVLLAAALSGHPDLLLLDEPTNHLDIEAIEWLESYLKSFNGCVLLVTHDREFLSQVSNRIVEIDRGKLYQYDCDYETYLDRRESLRLADQKQNELFDKKLAAEEVWIRTGIQARRTRNEGRVRALKALRQEYKARRNQLGQVKSVSLEVTRSGTTVIEANQVNHTLGNKTILHDFSLLVTRGDKLGIIGPNGCGKTTLVRLLLQELQPDSGQIKLGTSLSIAYFDQLRQQLREDQTVMFHVADGADYVTVNGKQKHVTRYLRDFLFSPERFNQPVSVLSGGEKNRLLLAKLLAKPVNLLVMDEPTNDLDIETMELLEDMLVDYPGTLIVISHDRAFIDHVVTSVLVYEDEGEFNEFVGGYHEYKMKKKQQRHVAVKTPLVKQKLSPNKLSYNAQRELEQLPDKIERLEEKIAHIHEQMANAKFYQQEEQIITKINQELLEDEAVLMKFYARWEELLNFGKN